MPEKNFINELTALIHLLDEPDEKVYSAIRSRIIAMGIKAFPLLEEVQNNTFDAKEAIRLGEIVNTIKVEDTYSKLTTWAKLKSYDLLEAWIIISKFHSPEDNTENITASIDKIYRDIWVEMNRELTALEKIRVINHVFYSVYQFDSLQESKPHLSSFLPGNLIRMQKGNPLSLAMLYLIVVQRLGIPVFGVNLPLHFILAYTNGKTLLKRATDYQQTDILFYINPFNKGAVFRKSEIELYVKQLNIKEQETFYLPCENKIIVGRLLKELASLHKRNNNLIMADAMKYFLQAIA